MGVFDIFKKKAKKREILLDFLNSKITDGTSIGNIVDIFEQMCQIPIKEDMVLFETGTYTFTGELLFYFCLVRQFPNGEDEYYQIHVDVQYTPTLKNKDFNEEIWSFDLSENIFDYIRKSEIYSAISNDEYINVDIYIDET